MIYLWDTNTASAAMEREPTLTERVAALRDGDEVVVSTITRGEIRYGIARLPEGRRRQTLADEAEALFAQSASLPVTDRVADTFGELKAQVEEAGRPIGKDNDLWIAAVARAHGCVLVSAQTSFTHVPDLVVEDWTASL